MIKMTLSDLIKDSGLKKGHIAKQVGVSDDTLTNWIKGKTFPRLDQAVRLADVLGCEIKELYQKDDY